MDPDTQVTVETAPEENETQEKKPTKQELKLQLFKQKYIELGNAKDAYLAINPGITEDSARTLGARMFAKVDIVELMEDMGITDKALIQMLAVGISKPTKFEKVKQYTGGAADFQEMPDYATRHKYLDTAFRLKKRLLPINVSDKANHQQFNIGNATIQVVSYADTKDITVKEEPFVPPSDEVAEVQ